MKLEKIKVGLAVTGSFCTFNNFIGHIKELAAEAESVTPIFSESMSGFDTRFNTGKDRKDIVEAITGNAAITTVTEAESIGPESLFDVLVVAPCTGNTLAKLAASITDSTVTMAVKAHLRNNRPVVIGVSTNDGLGGNAKNLGALLNTKNIYFIPFYQDDPVNKEKSLTFVSDLTIDTILRAINGKQIQPLIQVRQTLASY